MYTGLRLSAPEAAYEVRRLRMAAPSPAELAGALFLVMAECVQVPATTLCRSRRALSVVLRWIGANLHQPRVARLHGGSRQPLEATSHWTHSMMRLVAIESSPQISRVHPSSRSLHVNLVLSSRLPRAYFHYHLCVVPRTTPTRAVRLCQLVVLPMGKLARDRVPGPGGVRGIRRCP